jgi:hypothetical protein
MALSAFEWVNFDFQSNSSRQQESRVFGIEGNPSSSQQETRFFTVEGTPRGDGYLLIQALNFEQGNHQILINDEALPSFDISTGGNNQWVTWMERIPERHLEQGENRITIRRVNGGNFRVANVAIRWRELGRPVPPGGPDGILPPG